MITGIVLILASLIFRYGAELDEQNRFLISDGEKRMLSQAEILFPMNAAL
ncbi:MAG: hypothetical protein ACI4EG_05905 [Fusicatenibacter sp.]